MNPTLNSDLGNYFKARSTSHEIVSNKVISPAKIAKGSITCTREYKSKSLSGPASAFYADFIFSDINVDLDGDKVPINKIATKIDGMVADLEHANLYNRTEVSQQPLFQVKRSFFSDDKLFGTVEFFPSHPQFADVWSHCQNGDFGISMEYDAEWNIVGVTGTMVPRNPRSKIINAYTSQ